MVDYAGLDAILDTLEELLSPFTNNLNRASIERWRWDEPVMTLTWVGSDQVARNIHALIVEKAPYSEGRTVEVEVNAWRDEDSEDGQARVRKWRHQNMGAVSTDDVPKLRSTLTQALDVVSRWNLEDLQNGVHLTPDPARSTQGPTRKLSRSA